ncbi:hypothetical protein MTP99_009119 [Tenebrio molitor]|jgi:hypothetical protein|nr:hypothetical protein MTP99_009119 [Tenebrio molitor]
MSPVSFEGNKPVITLAINSSNPSLKIDQTQTIPHMEKKTNNTYVFTKQLSAVFRSYGADHNMTFPPAIRNKTIQTVTNTQLASEDSVTSSGKYQRNHLNLQQLVALPYKLLQKPGQGKRNKINLVNYHLVGDLITNVTKCGKNSFGRENINELLTP